MRRPKRPRTMFSPIPALWTVVGSSIHCCLTLDGFEHSTKQGAAVRPKGQSTHVTECRPPIMNMSSPASPLRTRQGWAWASHGNAVAMKDVANVLRNRSGDKTGPAVRGGELGQTSGLWRRMLVGRRNISSSFTHASAYDRPLIACCATSSRIGSAWISNTAHGSCQRSALHTWTLHFRATYR